MAALRVHMGAAGTADVRDARPELDIAHIYDLHFDVPMSSPVFDVWIDDIAFYY